VDREIRKFEEKFEEVMKELKIIKKDLSENNRKIDREFGGKSLGKASEGNDYDKEGDLSCRKVNVLKKCDFKEIGFR